MKATGNSRRHFLGMMAVLTSGTVLAGSPTVLFNSKTNDGEQLRNQWKKLLAQQDASSYLNLLGTTFTDTAIPAAGHTHKAGAMVCFEKENLLAKPTWVHWGNNSDPDDVLISLYENRHPYKKLKTLNRYELDALVALAVNNQDVSLTSICVKTKEAPRSIVSTTRISRSKKLQDINLYNHQQLILSEQLFYNV